ncbi:hypothetical protein I5907_11170 [Panacibacter sp. DH6]|uniref:Uncharacterized protein n=1 Tax=Panacibacter microcysteis TaxID=2793269 RepID=A0A931EAJ9_9BACT|nr:hypothetical protein [Panacibacter microcysteis]MBG9376801.1 hypothetical protein [Panacibacter microcysteis]
MKTCRPLTTVVLFILCFACKREVVKQTSLGAFSVQALATFTDTVKIPINDLGAGTFMGKVGGLYPGGVNAPFGTYAADLMTFSKDIKPLNADGEPASNGVVGFIAIGGSTCGKMMSALTDKTTGNPLTNGKLKMVNCTNGEGSASLNSLMNASDTIWPIIMNKLGRRKLTVSQVQVIYLETDDSIQLSGFPDRPLRAKQEYVQTLKMFKTKFPNVKLVYVLGRTTTFLTKKKKLIHNVEPNPYYNGWACKWLIEDQMNGVPGTRYKGASAEVPMVTWGWYQWAYGTSQPRKDGFTWEASDTEDGLHATPAGSDTLSGYFQNFLLTDIYAKNWYGKQD